ncbi:protein kinase [Streptomyces sp. B93]|uniref:protein kinase n=1 Tax=Streptomyces sp. B93 TaxID=2824875 RepID=UPI001B359100|nr:protein kinase [Streptomyces sp. B93]MBQ1090152.1 protein kinase [Streptomyces sp. B93]
MDDYAGRVLADRYRLPLPPSDEYELTESRAFDTYSGQEVLVRQVPLPEVVEAEVLDAEGLPDGFTRRDRGPAARRPAARGGTRRPTDPVVRRAMEAAQAAARIPDHPRLDQVFDVFAEGGSLWIVSELVAARPLAALLAEKPLTPYRAAEVASDVLMALRVLHAHGWVHRNVTARTVLVCDDGRVMLTGLAAGAAEEALCGYDPVPPEDDGPAGGVEAPGPVAGAPGPAGSPGADPEAARRAAIEARAAGRLPVAGAEGAGGGSGAGASAAVARRTPESGSGGGDIRAARAGAIAAYRAGARAAARVQEAQNGRAALPGARPASEGGPAAPSYTAGAEPEVASPPGQIADPYGVGATSWHGAAPRRTAPEGVPGFPTQNTGQSAGQHNGQNTGQHTGQHNGQSFGYHNGQGNGQGNGLTQVPPVPPVPQVPQAPQGPLAPGHVPGQSPGQASRQAPGQVPGQPALGPVQGRTALPSGAAAGGAGTSSRWDDLVAGAPVRRGPATALDAERARQARMAVVGPVTERWAPEQAGPVHENWQLAPPIGPQTDLWALGALLFRAVQGHAPYPEESTAELVQMVCAEPPAFAEECGPLRPVVESLLRQDPTERLDFEELRGWLRSLVRSAPEPDAGLNVVAAPPVETSRLPVVRRRGELVRRRRAGLPATHGRHKRGKQKSRSPRALGRTLLVLVLLALAGAIAYAMLFMPKADSGAGGTERTGVAGEVSQAPVDPTPEASSEPRPDQTAPPAASGDPDGSAGQTQTTGPDVAEGFELRSDVEGFRIAVAKGWQRAPKNGDGQVVYSRGAFRLIVVPGRDGTGEYGTDPMTYQRERERELQPYRESSWATASGMKSIEVGERSMAEGQFTWSDGEGAEVYVRNLAILVGDRYHVVQVRGPETERDEVTRLFEQASATYQVTG